MKKITFKTAFLTTGILTLGLTACKKEEIIPTGVKKNKTSAESEKSGVYYEGIVSHDGYSSGDIITDLYQFYGPFPNTNSTGVYGVGTTNTTIKGCGASTGVIIYAYKSSTGAQFLGSMLYGDVPITDGSGNLFTQAIEEIEIHPQTGIVYALVTQSNSKRIYAIDPYTGIYTPITVNGGPGTILFNATLGNGYKGGSICFIPDGSGGFELLFSHESDVYAANGVYSWHYSLSGTNLTGLPAKSKSYIGIPGTFGKGINTTYGNGKLYFARHLVSPALKNQLYTLDPLSSSWSAVSGDSVTNTNDFGYWKSF